MAPAPVEMVSVVELFAAVASPAQTAQGGKAGPGADAVCFVKQYTEFGL